MNYKIILSANQFYQEIELTDQKPDFKIGTRPGCDIRIGENMVSEEFEIMVCNHQGWQLKSSENAVFRTGEWEPTNNHILERGDKVSVCFQSSGEYILTLFYNVDFPIRNRNYDLKIRYAGKSEFTIGNGKQDIVIQTPELEDDELKISCQNGELIIDTRLAGYGISVNGIVRTEKTVVIRNKDFFSLRGFQFYVFNGDLYTMCDGNIVTRLPSTQLQYVNNHFNYPKFVQNVRQQYLLPEEQIEILDPKELPTKPENNLLMSFLPSILSIVLIVAIRGSMGNGGTYVLYSVAMMGVGIITSIITYVSSGKKYRKDIEQREKSYRSYLEEKEQEIREQRNCEHEILNNRMPTVSDDIKRVADFDSRLFEKAKDHEDYMTIQIGKGIVQTACHAEYRKHEYFDTEDYLSDYPKSLSDKYEYMQEMPVTLSLKDADAIGFVGSRSKLYQMAKNMILNLCIEHFYQDVKLFFLLEEDDAALFSWARWMQNTFMGDCVIRNYMYDDASIRNVLEYLYGELSNRSEMKGDAIKQCPNIVVFVYLSQRISNHPIIKYVENAHELGFTFLFFEEFQELLNKNCTRRVFLHSTENKGYIQDAKDGTRIQEFCYEHVPRDIAAQTALKLGCVYIDEVSLESTLRKNISLFQLLHIMSVNDLDLERRWKKSKVYESMAAPLGVKSGDEVVYLDLHEKKHGPHGLVAGTTGSGKSEILQSYILSMATLFHPYEVGFIIIDFKGGGMVNQFRKLPHLNGAITNIDGKEIDRSLLSIRAELQKRQELFAKYEVNHIDDYIRKFQQKITTIPLPHLILIVDEFAELKSEHPDFMKELISTARIGRSLGVHLILATQKPSGVVNDQIWSNSKFKLCLKVQTQSDSNEVLKVPLAAEIREPGRAYLQVGNNEIFCLFQSAYSGAMVPDGSMGERKPFKISMVNLCGQREVIYERKAKEDKNGITQLSALVNYIDKYCQKKGIAKLQEICLPTLSTDIGYDAVDYEFPATDICVPLGIYDAPQRQYQGNFDVNISQNHVFFMGSAQMGKTNALQCIIRGIVSNYSSEDVRIYIFDFASQILNVFGELKHTEEVLLPSDNEKIPATFRMLEREIVERKQKLAETGLSSISAYRESGAKDTPQIVILIDNLSAFRELYSEMEESLIRIIREGVTLGISVVVTAQQSSGLGYRYISCFSKKYALFCNDSSEYSLMCGRSKLQPDNHPGRCIFELNKEVHEGQVFHAFSVEKEVDRVREIRGFIEQINQQDKGEYRKKTEAVFENITKEYLFEKLKEDCQQDYVIPLGMSLERLEADAIDLTSFSILGICGPEKKNIFVKYLLDCMVDNTWKSKPDIWIIDEEKESLGEFREKANGYSSVVDDMEKMFCRILEGTREDGTSAFQCIIINSGQAYERLCNDKELYELCKKVFEQNEERILILFADIPNKSDALRQGELGPLLKNAEQMLIFYDLDKLEVLNLKYKSKNNLYGRLKNGEMYFKCGGTLEKYRIALR